MFRPNKKHLQQELFGIVNTFPESLQKEILSSEEFAFYELIFTNINENDFSCLYSDIDSRPNAPVNVLVSALLLRERNSWTFEKLFRDIKFDSLTKVALGLHQWADIPFAPATLYNFMNRLVEHFTKTGENLLERVFDSLTSQQLKALQLRTNIQRTDSLQAQSNIRHYTRVQLLVELLLRIYRILTDEDKQRFTDIFAPYVKQTSGQFIYKLKASDIPHTLDKLGEVYHQIAQSLLPRYHDTEIFRIFERVYNEHFTVTEEKITIKQPEEMNSSSVQSPDDLDATYRRKNDTNYKGQSINIVETAHPDNPINLLTDIAVSPNNIDDSDVLQDRLPILKTKTLDLDELHCDGAYGSEDNDRVGEDLGVTFIQSAVRGQTSDSVPLTITQAESAEADYSVSCPTQEAQVLKTPKRYKAVFLRTICDTCPLQNECALRKTARGDRVYYFNHQEYLKKKRLAARHSLPLERQKLRPNVEASVFEFGRRMPRGKLKVRGYFNTCMFAFATGIAINFGRIVRYLGSNRPKEPVIVAAQNGVYVKEQHSMPIPLLFYIEQCFCILFNAISRFWPIRKSLSFVIN